MDRTSAWAKKPGHSSLRFRRVHDICLFLHASIHPPAVRRLAYRLHFCRTLMRSKAETRSRQVFLVKILALKTGGAPAHPRVEGGCCNVCACYCESGIISLNTPPFTSEPRKDQFSCFSDKSPSPGFAEVTGGSPMLSQPV